MSRAIIIPLRTPRAFVSSTIVAPSGVVITFHILTEASDGLLTEAGDNLRTE